MHEVIEQFPKGRVVGSCRLQRFDQTIDVTRVRQGARTRFVESVVHLGRCGPVRTALRQTDEFMSDAIADRWIAGWLDGIVNNRGYQVVHKDVEFDQQEETWQGQSQPS